MILKILSRVDTWIYVAMAAIFLSGIFYCLLPIREIQGSLTVAQKKLMQRRSDGSFVYNQTDFLRCPRVDGWWAKFISNLNLLRRNNGVCDVTDFINPRTMIHEPGHSVYGEMIPGMLTTLGILGSFYGIVQGLSTLDLGTTESMGISIATLISGMRTAFNTSIVGAILALTFQLLRRVTIESASRTLASFVSSCQSEINALLTPDATLMQTLHAILAELRGISSRLQ